MHLCALSVASRIEVMFKEGRDRIADGLTWDLQSEVMFGVMPQVVMLEIVLELLRLRNVVPLHD
jgi:hypothetical protein